MIRRLVVVLGVTAMVALGGCASDVSGTPAAAGGGTDSGRGAGQDSGGTGTSREEGFDPCTMLEMAEVAEWIGTDSMYLTSADVMHHDDGTKSATCQFYPEDVPGLHGMNISYVANADPDQFFRGFEQNFENILPLEIGDRGAAVSYKANGTERHFYEVRAIQGNHGIHMFYAYNGPGGAMPEVNNGAARWGAMLNTAFERLPEELDFPDGKPEGVCADFDVDLAEEVLEGELTTARSVVGDDGAAACVFGGGSGRLAVTVFTDPARVSSNAPEPSAINHDDIGDGARIRINEAQPGGQGPLDALTKVDDAVVAVIASYGEGVNGLTEPRPEDVELVRAIVDAVGGQD